MSEITLPEQVSGSPVDHLSSYPPYVWAGLGALVVAVAGIVVLARLAWRARSTSAGQSNGADLLTRAAALIATIVAGQGMWQFLDRIIGEVHWSIRALMFAFLEIAVITSAVRARRSMRENYSAGIDGIAVWALTSTSAVLAALEAGSAPEALFRLAAPLVAAWLWERGMAIERRRIRGRSSIHWRITPERIFVRLGLAESRERTASEVDTQRRLTRVALAAKRARALREIGARKGRQLKAIAAMERAYASAHAHTSLGRDTAIQRRLADEVGSLYSAAELLNVPPASAWTDIAEQSRPVSGVDLISAGLSRWSREILREPASAVATRDLSGDQDATTTATSPATLIPALRRRIVGAPGNPWPIGRLVPLQTWTRQETRPVDGRFPLPPADDERDGQQDTAPASARREDSSGTRPGHDRGDDQKEPTEQDKRRVARWWVRRVEAGEYLSKWGLAERTGFKPTWCGDRIAEGKQILTDKGWSLDERGRPVRPAAVDADPVAPAQRPEAAEPSLNGARPVSA